MKRKRILVLEDDPPTVDVLRVLLEARGYEVFCATGASQADKLAREHVPDLVLVDVALPDIDGFQFSSWLRNRAPTAKTVIIGHSGHGGDNFYQRAREAGMDYYLVKPVDPDVLLAVLEPERHPQIINRFLERRLNDRLNIIEGGSARALSERGRDAVARAREACLNDKPIREQKPGVNSRPA